MTTVDVVYRYATHPTEAKMMALGNAREVYGIRRIVLNQQHKTIRVEYDATRLTTAAVAQLLRRAGIFVIEEMPLIPPQLAPSTTGEKKESPQSK